MRGTEGSPRNGSRSHRDVFGSEIVPGMTLPLNLFDHQNCCACLAVERRLIPYLVWASVLGLRVCQVEDREVRTVARDVDNTQLHDCCFSLWQRGLWGPPLHPRLRLKTQIATICGTFNPGELPRATSTTCHGAQGRGVDVVMTCEVKRRPANYMPETEL